MSCSSSSLKFQKFIAITLLLAFPLMGLTACDSAQNKLKADRDAGLDPQDFKDSFASRIEAEEAKRKSSATSSGAPSLQPYIASPSGSIEPMPLVSISVNQSVPLRDVLYELATQADYDLELDPRISGAIVFSARNRPLDSVIERISKMAGLRYTLEDDILRVELDTPYTKNYRIDYINLVRESSGSIRNNIAVVSGEGADTGSDYEARISSTADFWAELETNLSQILQNEDLRVMRTNASPQLSALDQNPNIQPVMPGQNGQMQVQPPQVNLQANFADEPALEIPPSAYSLNRQAGIVSVFAPERRQKEIEDYLIELKRAVASQVLIEAKILAVTLDDAYNTGIDWRILDGFGVAEVLNFTGPAGFSSLDAIDSSRRLANEGVSEFLLGYSGNDFDALVSALQTFGTVRALASPRLTVMNNQSAVLNVATNRVFFEIDIDVTTDEGVSQVDVESDIRNVPEGVLVNVQPSIDLDNNTVSMALRPTVTDIVDEIPDPAVAFAANTSLASLQNTSSGASEATISTLSGFQSLIPEVNVQEIDTIVKVKSGNAIVMGGLLQDSTSVEQEGVPVLSEVPLVGNLFKNNVSTISKTELVIFLKATILDTDGSNSIHETDKHFYRKFSTDRRPLRL